MPYRWYVFVASLTSMVIGFGLAMLFIQSYAVPNFLYRINSFPGQTECFVDEVRITEGSPSCSGPECQLKHSQHCLHFPLVYRGDNGTLKDGYLIPRNLAEESDKTKCYCNGCRGKHQVNGNQTSYVVLGETILLKSWMTCFYITPVSSQVGVKKISTWVMLNAMLWPTLLFVCGFMGVFFSCLFLQHDQCLQKKRDCLCCFC